MSRNWTSKTIDDVPRCYGICFCCFGLIIEMICCWYDHNDEMMIIFSMMIRNLLPIFRTSLIIIIITLLIMMLMMLLVLLLLLVVMMTMMTVQFQLVLINTSLMISMSKMITIAITHMPALDISRLLLQEWIYPPTLFCSGRSCRSYKIPRRQ